MLFEHVPVFEFFQNFEVFLSFVMVLLGGISLSGCARGVLGYHIKNMPNKIVYQVGEQVNFDGLAIRDTKYRVHVIQKNRWYSW